MAGAEGRKNIERSPVLFHAYTFSVPLLVPAGILLGGGWTFAALLFGFVVNPLLDAFAGSKFGRSIARDDSAFRGYDILTYLLLPVMVAVVGHSIWFVAFQGATALETVGVILSCGAATATVSVTTGHELVHKLRPWQRALGIGHLLLVSNGHFRIAHVHNHHRHVGTPLDPASARLGEPIYAFIPRSIYGQYVSAWRIENARLDRRGRAVFGWRNRMIWYTAVPLATVASLWLILGPMAAAVFAGQSVVAYFSLEMANYLGHYGLERRQIAPGKYEPTNVYHSWNAAHRATDHFFLGLGRHSAHHFDTMLGYPELGNLPEWPQHTLGYHATFLIALVPPLWRRYMEPKVAMARVKMERAFPLSPVGRGQAARTVEISPEFV